MLASVIVITKNQLSYLQQSLPSLLTQQLPGEFEIIVVDSGSTDGSREYVATLPVKLIKTDPNAFNYARAFNIGAKKAKGEFLVRLSGDVIPKTERFLASLLKPFSDPTVGATYGKYTFSGRPGQTHPTSWPPERFPSDLTRYSIRMNIIKSIISQKYLDELTNLAGGCCAIRRSIWEKRPFNERMIEAEDAEYSIYLHLQNHDIVYTPKAEVIHEHSASSPEKPLFYKIASTLRYLSEVLRIWFKYR